MAVDIKSSPLDQENQSTAAPQEEQKKKKQIKKVFINEELFGSSRLLEDIDVEEGIAHVKIRSEEIGNIPGLIEHWQTEIHKRKKEIEAYQNTGFIQRVSSLLQGEAVSPSVSGKELAHYHPTKAALEKVKILKNDPTDMMARLELVSIVAKSGRDFPTEVYRLLLLQATIACCFGELTNVGLQMVIWTQDIYFSKLLQKCQNESSALEAKLKKDQEKENAFNRQSQEMRHHVALVKRNMQIIKNYQNQTEKAFKENKDGYNTTLNVSEITAYVLDMGKKDPLERQQDEKWMSIVKRTAELILLLRVLPLLKEETDKLCDLLKKIDKTDPVPHFLAAKVEMTDLLFKVGMYEGGERTVELRNAVQESFKKVHHLYGLAVKKVGKLPKTKMECTIFVEYASLIHYFYKISKTTLGIYLPKDWLWAVFQKAIHLLELAQEKGQVEALMRDIQKDMLDEGMDKMPTGATLQ